MAISKKAKMTGWNFKEPLTSQPLEITGILPDGTSYRYVIQVSQASNYIGMVRAGEIKKANDEIAEMRRENDELRKAGEAGNEQVDDPRLLAMRRAFYPDCVSCSQGMEGFENWPPTFEEFHDLPEAVTSPWIDEVYRLNPHWAWWESAAKEAGKKK